LATYKLIQKFIGDKHGYVPKTCWIAHVKSDHGLVTRTAPNRASVSERKYPCPPDKRPHIEGALKHFGMI